ncbi:tenascin [Apostichopus japonicus]|uniref:Tenascin n=1 Tax=Stichopus japonicus TaxID=307972 RepID=A0A2G8JIT3_STIJA|nr:tenascin [Apostichopus japonicus]
MLAFVVNLISVKTTEETTERSTRPTTEQQSTESIKTTEETTELSTGSTTEQQSTESSTFVPTCPTNMIYGTCSCQATCEDPNSDCLGSEGCICPAGFLMQGSDCVSASECGCFVAEANLVIPNGETYVNDDCTQKCSCNNNQLIYEDDYSCSTNAVCDLKNEYDSVIVMRDMKVFQRRIGGSTSFFRNWAAYKNGFGDVNVDFWLGNEKLYYLTNQKYYSLRFDVTTSNRDSKYALYSEFQIMSESHNYRLDRLGSHSGTTGTRTLDNNKGKDFSTFDRDNDGCDKYNCAVRHRGGWWHSDSWCNYCNIGGTHCDQFHYTGESSCYTVCTSENLNGYYNGAHGQNIFSDHDAYCDITFTEMKIRPT